MPLDTFHPAVAAWFGRTFAAPTEAQAAAWPAIRAGRHTLVAAPTGSGKTLTAFLAALDALVRRGAAEGGLPDETTVLYVSPLKALSNDIRANLEQPLAGIRAELDRLGLPPFEIRVGVRTGDTPPRERRLAARRPPHIVVTTPESFYVLLGSDSGRAMLKTVRTAIVDEIHALAPNKRGAHLALSLERLDALVGAPVTRIGLSATQKPIGEVARFLTGPALCAIVDVGHGKPRDLALEVPPTPLAAVMSNEQWEQVYARLVELIAQHRTTLVFVNTRRMAERAARHLGERLGREAVAAHHGSLAKEARQLAEQRLRRGELQVLVATASLELGLDIGEVELVCQLGSPRGIATFLQRAGRSGHAVGGVPKARLFPQTRDELVECTALLDCTLRGELDAIRIRAAPLDVLAQQIVAETACREWDEDELYALVRRARPYAELPRERFDAVVAMLAEGYATRHGPRAGVVHRDAVNHRLRERRGARMTALMSGGTIPETGDYAVVLEPAADKIGTVHEDFAVESMAGDVFQLGNASYRILGIETGRVRVEDAHGAAPNIPFWLGEAPGRSDELSAGVARLRAEVAAALAGRGVEAVAADLAARLPIGAAAAHQLVDYLARTLAALGAMPTQDLLVLERFFDASGGMQLVLHAPFGSRLNRAWGLALRKRFCRQFNFELQAAATEDAILLSLSSAHSFALAEVAHYLHPATAYDVLVQALLDAPLFAVRWRWNATTALALPRMLGGRKVAPQLQRMRSEDLLAAVFPDQVACAENLTGPRAVPDHPLVAQTLVDCLEEAMDAPGWLAVLRRIERGAIAVVARDLPAPSPFAAEALQARPWAYLDDAPIEERRSRAVQARGYADGALEDDLATLDGDAIAGVREEAWPAPRSADELHEGLVGLGIVTDAEVAANLGWHAWLTALAAAGRATRLVPDAMPERGAWVAAERLALVRQVHPGAACDPPIRAPDAIPASVDRAPALRELARARLGGLGPVTCAALAGSLAVAGPDIETALLALQAEGTVLRGRYTPGASTEEWCERHLLARIHRYTLKRLRREIEPVEPRDYMRFLFDWQHLGAATRVKGPEALPAILAQLEGYEAPAAAWEPELLAARVDDYAATWLDDLCTAGRTLWARLRPSSADGTGSLRATPVVLLPRRSAPLWRTLAPPVADDAALGARARRVLEWLQAHGASFFEELQQGTRMLQAELEAALAELVMQGKVQSDSYAGLRALLVPPSKRATLAHRPRRRLALSGIEDAGRWAPLPPSAPDESPDAAALEHLARSLLRRYGVIGWRLVEREAAWLPRWRDLVRVLRRLEARGEVRGGRFVAGISGEQFALPEAVAAIRAVRRGAPDGGWVCLAAVDPANLLGTVVAGTKVPRVSGARVLWRDGVPVATRMAGGPIDWLQPLAGPERTTAEAALLHGPGGHPPGRAMRPTVPVTPADASR